MLVQISTTMFGEKIELKWLSHLREVSDVAAAAAFDLLVLLELLHLDVDVPGDVGDVRVPQLHPQVVVLVEHHL